MLYYTYDVVRIPLPALCVLIPQADPEARVLRKIRQLRLNGGQHFRLL